MTARDSLDRMKARWDGQQAGEGQKRIKAVRTKPMRYVSLHHHSTFSFKDGFALPEAHVRRAGDLNMSALALTEHGNVSSHVQLEKAAEKDGIKALFGCEIYAGAVDEENRSQSKNHLTVLAADLEGYRNLLRVVSQGWSDFYYEPTVSGQVLNDHKTGLVVLSGCTGSLLATSLVGGKGIPVEAASYGRAKTVARRFHNSLGDAYYLEVQAFPELEVTRAINPAYERMSRELGIPLVASGDVHYTKPSESEMQQILHNVRGGNRMTMEQLAQTWGYDVKLCPPTSDKLIYDKLRATGLSHLAAEEAIANTAEIAERCNVTLPKLEQLRFPLPEGYADINECWRDWIRQGWFFRRCNELPPKERERYRKQLTYEMSIIEGKDYLDYFLVVSDLVKFAKESRIPVGPARGSAAASIVCWLLRITEVNPMLFPGMVFERFIDLSREDLPDIDLDFDSEQRWKIRDYLVGVYGKACVNNIGAFQTYKAKVSLDDVARSFRIPQYEADIVKGLLLERSSGDLRASATIEDTVEMFEEAAKVFERHPKLANAMKLEGNYRGLSVHSAGLVVSNGPITDVCAVYEREVKGELLQVISLDKYDADRQGLLKIDVLGLNTMTMLKDALDIVGMELQDLYDIPLDDPAVIAGFQANDVVGIFQFDGRAMRSVNAELQPDNFKEVCDVNALARPGPLHNNASAEYIDIKKGRKEPQTVHPLLDPIVVDTHYQIVYQEQILRIVREIGNFDWTSAAYIRKIISKKLGEQEFSRQFDKFWEGAKSKGMDEETARSIWGNCITAGSYAFNLAHCVSYGMLAWWTMWFKVHHPQAFYVASLRKMPEKKQLEYLRDAAKHNLTAYPPDPTHSEATWAPFKDDGILAGFAQVHGFGDKMAPRMIEWREEFLAGGGGLLRQEEIDWDDYRNVVGIGPKKVQALKDFAEQDDPFEIHKLHRQLEEVRGFIRGTRRLPNPTHTAAEIPYSRGNDVNVVWCGIIRHLNLRDLFESNFARTGVPLDPETVRDPELREWVIGIGVDEDELVTITWDRWMYPKVKDVIFSIKHEHDVVLIKGVKRGFQARRALYVKEFWVLDPDDEEDEDANVPDIT